jgi:hypothetical protein
MVRIGGREIRQENCKGKVSSKDEREEEMWTKMTIWRVNESSKKRTHTKERDS